MKVQACVWQACCTHPLHAWCRAQRLPPPARPQALWSQGRERANVLTIICANSSYAILKVRRGLRARAGA